MGGTLTEAERDQIDRYFAGTLDEQAIIDIEARVITDRRFRSEFDLTQIMRDGLADLDRNGAMDGLVRERRFWQRPLYSLAASMVALAATGTALFLVVEIRQLHENQLPAGHAASAGAALVVGRHREVLQLAATRALRDEPDVVWRIDPEVSELELHMDVGRTPAAAYSLRVERMDDTDAIAFAVPAIAPIGEEIVATVNAGLLPAGDYRLVLTPKGSRQRTTVRLRIEQFGSRATR
jgi:hypothetical protein